MLPNSLNIALKNYGACLGSAGSIFGVFYYILIALVTAFMSIFHNESVMTMPLYFLVLSLILLVFSYYLVRLSQPGSNRSDKRAISTAPDKI